MATNLFDVLDTVAALLEEDMPDAAYIIMKNAIDEDTHGFALSFVAAWLEHLATEDAEIQKKYEELVLCLKEDYPELASVGSGLQPEVEEDHHEEEVPAEVSENVPPPAVLGETELQPEPELEPEPRPEPAPSPAPEQQPEAEREQVTLTFYDWQMSAIRKAARKQDVDDAMLLSYILETGNVKPLLFSRYKPGAASPSRRITISLAHNAKNSIEVQKKLEGVKTTTKYVRKMLFGNRAEKF